MAGPRTHEFKKKAAAAPPETTRRRRRLGVDRPSTVHEVNRDEVDRILDKISAQGIGSLTPQERVFLLHFVPTDDRMPPES